MLKGILAKMVSIRFHKSCSGLRTMRHLSIAASLVTLFAVSTTVKAQASAVPTGSNASACPRYAPGSSLIEAKDLFSKNGVLRVNLAYSTRVDEDGATSYCFMTDDGVQSPTLHVRAGDQLLITMKNALPETLMPSTTNAEAMLMPSLPELPWVPDVAVSGKSASCAAGLMSKAAKALGILPSDVSTCGMQDAVKTVVDGGEAIQYAVRFPADAKPGMYWYYPHMHGFVEPLVQGGASGAIIVEGIEKTHRELAGLPVRTLIVRNMMAGDGTALQTEELSLNYVPEGTTTNAPATIPIKPEQKQLWRVLNASADTTLDLVVQYDGTSQPLQVIGVDGAPAGVTMTPANGSRVSHILLAPAARAEFVVTGPGVLVRDAKLLTLAVDPGMNGALEPQRSLGKILATPTADEPALKVPQISEVSAETVTVAGLD